MDDKFLIHVRINRSEEQIAREAVKQIREKMSQYRKVYPEAEEKDLLAMVAFQLSIENLKFEDRNDIDPFTEKVEELTNELENYLKG